MSEEKPVLVETGGGLCWITLNRPSKLNSLSLEMLDMVSEALDQAESDAAIRCIVITGAGDRAFSAGADIGAIAKLSSDETEAFSEKGHQTVTRILRHSKPVVAAVNGYALGGGCELASACDFRIASEKARFGQTEVNLGLIPGWGGTVLLPRLVGPNRAKEMIMTGTTITAEDALKAGLVNKVVPADKFLDEVKAYAAALASGPSLALAEAKKLVNDYLISEAALTKEAEGFSQLFSTVDFREGISAFSEKRKPAFRGR